MMDRTTLLDSKRGRLTLFSLLYLSEGIPWGFSAIALAAYLRRQGVGIGEIGFFTAALYAPWGFKWAWAPLVDLIRPQRFGPSRSWIVAAQLLMMGTMASLLVFEIEHNLQLLTSLIVLHNVFAATQDIAIDALAVRVLPDSELGVANGFMFGSQYLGQAIGGSGALYVSGLLGFRASFAFILVCMGALLVGVSIRIREPEVPRAESISPAGGLIRRTGHELRSFLRDLSTGFFRSGSGPLVGVVFSVLPTGAMALGLALGTTMMVDLGLSETQIANLTLATTVSAAIGCVVGGWISDRYGHRRCLALWYAMTAIPTFFLASRFTGLDGMMGVTLAAYAAAAISYNFAFGLQYGTSTAIFMGLTRKAVAATQFTGYMALHNLVYSYSSLWQGHVAEIYGYARALTLDGWLAFAPLLLIPFLKRPKNREGAAAPDTPPSRRPQSATAH